MPPRDEAPPWDAQRSGAGSGRPKHQAKEGPWERRGRVLGRGASFGRPTADDRTTGRLGAFVIGFVDRLDRLIVWTDGLNLARPGTTMRRIITNSIRLVRFLAREKGAGVAVRLIEEA